MSSDKKDYTAITRSISGSLGWLRAVAGAKETLTEFNAMSTAALADGALDKKTKELIALAIGVAKQCDGCIGFHTRTLKRLGATDEEIAEVLAMTIYMGGGPTAMYAADAWSAWEALNGD